MATDRLNLFNLRDPKIRTLHITWFAFFLSFVAWFSHAPLMPFIKQALALSDAEIKALLILNVALTIPARILVGVLVDKFGPRAIYSMLLVVSSFFAFGFAFSSSYEQLALFRFLLGFVGAGFVIGIRLVSEWFPARHLGLAEGIYGGWGNFGAAAAAMVLPTLAVAFGGADGWRYALVCVGITTLVYGLYFYRTIRNTPEGATYFKPKKSGGLEVTSRADFYFYLIMNIPMFLALAVLLWKLSPAGVGLLGPFGVTAFSIVLFALLVYQFYKIVQVNREHLRKGVPQIHQYKFKQVAILNLSYLVTFGSELAVVSMLPLFFMDTFELSPILAGLFASSFAVANLFARPGGGWCSDRFGRKRALSVVMAGVAVGYLAMSQIDSTWALPLAVVVTVACSLFVQAGCGAVFAVVPLIKRRMTGQIAGMTGAYGNVGGVVFLTVLSFVDASSFFMVIAASAVLCFVAVQFLDEPRGHMVEQNEDGSVQLIEVG